MSVLERPWPRASISRTLSVSGVLVAVVVASVALAAVSLTFSKAIAFDPEAWIVWAREGFGPGYLTTRGGRRGSRSRYC